MNNELLNRLTTALNAQLDLVTTLQANAGLTASSEATLALSYATSGLRDLVGALKEAGTELR